MGPRVVVNTVGVEKKNFVTELALVVHHLHQVVGQVSKPLAVLGDAHVVHLSRVRAHRCQALAALAQLAPHLDSVAKVVAELLIFQDVLL